MRLWIDLDNFAAAARDQVFRAALRTGLPVIAVGNRPAAPFLDLTGPSLAGDFHLDPALLEGRDVPVRVRVAPGPDMADRCIEANARLGDLVFTRDLLLADRLLQAGLSVANDRGDFWTRSSLDERLKQRNFALELRGMGIGGQGRRDHYSAADFQAFAREFDREFQRRYAAWQRSKATAGKKSE